MIPMHIAQLLGGMKPGLVSPRSGPGNTFPAISQPGVPGMAYAGGNPNFNEMGGGGLEGLIQMLLGNHWATANQRMQAF